jgi:hypothetical protein
MELDLRAYSVGFYDHLLLLRAVEVALGSLTLEEQDELATLTIDELTNLLEDMC